MLYAQVNAIFDQDKWCKIGIVQSGVYKLDYHQIKQSGLNLNGVSADKISLVSNGGGGALPQLITGSPEGKPKANSIQIEDGGDGTFDKGDYLLFYGNSPDRAVFDEANQQFDYEKNSYSDTTFYFLSIADSGSPSMQKLPVLGAGAKVEYAYQMTAHEVDQFNLMNSGRSWYGEEFDRSVNTHSIKLIKKLVGFVEGKMTVQVMASSLQPANFRILTGGTTVGELEVPERLSGDKTKGFDESDDFGLGQSFDGTVDLTFSTSDAEGFGFLDKIVVTSQVDLAYDEVQALFTLPTADVVFSFTIDNFQSGLSLWDVTDPTASEVVSVSIEGTFSYQKNEPSRYILFDPEETLEPVSISTINHQYLTSSLDAELLIITHKRFLTEANELADHRQNYSGLLTQVVPVDEIYDEYASGAPDVTAIRNFIFDVYQNGSLRHVLLFGDASFDYKKRIHPDENFVPTYQSRNSLTASFSYGSDDYYGFLEVGEGEWAEGLSGDHTMEIGVGRLPVKTTAEAQRVVDKIKRYDWESPMGNWRMQSLYSADDGDDNIHQGDADQVAELLFGQYQSQQAIKLYIDAYPQPNQMAVKAKKELYRRVHDGQLIVNYLGHGNESQLASEQLLVDFDLPTWSNDKLPLFVMLTCDFGVFDNPYWYSTGEKLILGYDHGAIGLVTATRQVLTNTNFDMNKSFTEEVFEKSNGKYRSLGDIFKTVKNENLNGRLNRNYALLADPSMVLKYPELNTQIDAVFTKNADLDSGFYTNQILEVHGSVSDQSNVTDVGFDGRVYIVVYDAPVSNITLGDENDSFQYETHTSYLYRGSAKVEAGLFVTEVLLPDATDLTNVSMQLYAVDDAGQFDASGGQLIAEILEGTNPTTDTQSPQVTIYIGDDSFVAGDQVTTDAHMLVYLRDESGIDLRIKDGASALVADLNGETIDLRDYYTSDTGGFQSGLVDYPFYNLEAGKYELTVRSADLYGNTSSASTHFTVAASSSLVINDFSAFPNPAHQQDIYYSFRLGKVGGKLDVRVVISDIYGRQVHEYHERIDVNSTTVEGLLWSAYHQENISVKQGMFVYRMMIISEDGTASNLKVGKVILE